MKFKPIITLIEFKEGTINIKPLKDIPNTIKFKERYPKKAEFSVAIKAKEKAYYDEFVQIEDNLLFTVHNTTLFN